MSVKKPTPAERVVRPEPSLLTLALSGFLATAGCSDDSNGTQPESDAGAETTASEGSGESYRDAGPASSAPATDAGAPESFTSDNEAATDRSTGSISGDADASTAAPASDTALGAVDAGGDTLGETDVDRDGVSVAEGDCNDFNDSVFPGAPELALDGEDSDCDGQEAPAMNLVWSATEENNAVDALAAMDANDDGEISLEEFDAQCAKTAKLSEASNPGILQYHASCAGNNSCRGMVLQSWGELYEHSCRGVNYCAGWSCVETPPDAERDGEAAFGAAHCGYCHSGATDAGVFAFDVPVPPGEDVEPYLQTFWSDRSDAYLRSIIAFGVSYTTPDGYRIANMPGVHHLISRAEIDRLIEHLRTLPLTSHPLNIPGADGGAPMGMD